jgi:hypothetical protein
VILARDDTFSSNVIVNPSAHLGAGSAKDPLDLTLETVESQGIPRVLCLSFLSLAWRGEFFEGALRMTPSHCRPAYNDEVRSWVLPQVLNV